MSTTTPHAAKSPICDRDIGKMRAITDNKNRACHPNGERADGKSSSHNQPSHADSSIARESGRFNHTKHVKTDCGSARLAGGEPTAVTAAVHQGLQTVCRERTPCNGSGLSSHQFTASKLTQPEKDPP